MSLTLRFPDPPRAPHFIVTLYGDVVEPRGGSLWMGTLIDRCARHGISESLVRTAVSRLVTAGHLDGVRLGRRSYYRLSDRAEAEFRAAARVLFDPPPVAKGWSVALLGPDSPEPPAPWMRFGPGVALAPHGKLPALPGAVLLTDTRPSGDMAGLAARLWPLDSVAQAYRRVLDRFATLSEAECSGPDALDLRLRLVDDWRRAALADPRLPQEALPPDWPAPAARALFVRLYHALSPGADAHVAAGFEAQDGPLPRQTAATLDRLVRLT